MTPYDIVFLLAMLLSALAAIGVGFHLAFRVFDNKKEGNNDDGYFAPPRHHQSVKDKPKPEKQKDKTKTGESGKLKKRIEARKQNISFSEFDCQFTGEDHQTKLEEIRGEQDSAYNFLGNKVNGK